MYMHVYIYNTHICIYTNDNLRASGFRPVPLHNEVFLCCCKARTDTELFSRGDAKLGGKTAQTTFRQKTERHQEPKALRIHTTPLWF